MILKETKKLLREFDEKYDKNPEDVIDKKLTIEITSQLNFLRTQLESFLEMNINSLKKNIHFEKYNRKINVKDVENKIKEISDLIIYFVDCVRIIEINKELGSIGTFDQ